MRPPRLELRNLRPFQVDQTTKTALVLSVAGVRLARTSSEGKEELDDRLVHSSFVYSPNVSIQIKDANGLDVQTARVGDPLTLRFVMDDENSAFTLVRSLVRCGSKSFDFEFILIYFQNYLPRNQLRTRSSSTTWSRRTAPPATRSR